MAFRRDAVSGDPSVNFVAIIGSATATTGNVQGFAFVTQFTFEPVPQLSGDYDDNGVVDATDYVVWRKGLGTTYVQTDYDVWLRRLRPNRRQHADRLLIQCPRARASHMGAAGLGNTGDVLADAR